MGDAAIFAEEEVLKGVTENIMMGQLARVGTGEVDLLLDEQKVVRDAVEVVVDNLSGDKDLGLVGAATPYASTPFQSSPMSGSGAEMTPFTGEGAFSPAVGAASFSPAYSPSSGTYGSGYDSGSYRSGSYGASDITSSPVYSPTSPAYSPTSP